MRALTTAVLAIGAMGVSVFAQAAQPTSAGAASAPSTRPTTVPATRPAMVIPQTPGTHRVTNAYVTVDGKELKLPFVLFLPETYREKGAKLPVLLFLHGVGESGTDLDAIFYHGPNFELIKKDNPFGREFPMIVISPQCPPRGQRWDRGNMDEYANALLDQVLPKLNADQDRVYATGLSMGGLGTWYVARNRPNRYAAIAPISSLEIDPAGTAMKLMHTAVLAITGEGDGAQIEQSGHMVNALRKQGALAEQTTGPDGHAVWIRAYAQPRTYEWLLMNHRGRPLPADEALPEKRGIHTMSAAPATQPAQRIDYLLRLPVDLKFPQRNRPLMAYFADPYRFGKLQQNLPLHGPMQFTADGGPGKAMPFIVIQFMLPPFSRETPEDMSTIARVLKEVATRYKVDQLYLAGSGEAAGLALQVSRMQGVGASAVVLDVPANGRFEPANPQNGTTAAVLAITNRPDGEVHARLKTIVEHSAEGSALAVQSQSQGTEQNAFFYPDLYQQLLKIRIKPERR